jgi:hypothetical protein
MLRIPCSLITAKEPGRIVQYGHGLLGGYGRGEGRLSGENGQRERVGDPRVDWTGMKSEDTLAIASMLIEDVSRFSIDPGAVDAGLRRADGGAADGARESGEGRRGDLRRGVLGDRSDAL